MIGVDRTGRDRFGMGWSGEERNGVERVGLCYSNQREVAASQMRKSLKS